MTNEHIQLWKGKEIVDIEIKPYHKKILNSNLLDQLVHLEPTAFLLAVLSSPTPKEVRAEYTHQEMIHLLTQKDYMTADLAKKEGARSISILTDIGFLKTQWRDKDGIYENVYVVEGTLAYHLSKLKGSLLLHPYEKGYLRSFDIGQKVLQLAG